MEMGMKAKIVIVGAGIAGLATAVGLYRLGFKSIVLETSTDLRVTGYAFTSWDNAWKVLDALGIGDLLREKRPRQQALILQSAIHGEISSQVSLVSSDKKSDIIERNCETRCLERKMLVETLANELPEGSIRFNSKVVSIEESNYHLKLIHLADGSTLKAYVLIGCDGVNSVVGRWLRLKESALAGRSVIRGHLIASTEQEHKITQYVGDGVKYGVAPIDQNNLFWFMMFNPSRYTEVEHDPVKMKQFVLSKLGKGSDKVRDTVEMTQVKDILCSRIKFKLPWEALWGKVTKGNVCVAGDAFHAMTPDLGQGACSSLEDGVILARCLGRAMQLAREQGDEEEAEYERIKVSLEEYAKKRRWRAFKLMTTSYLVGSFQLASWKVFQVLRDTILAPYLNIVVPKVAEYDCGQLN